MRIGLGGPKDSEGYIDLPDTFEDKNWAMAIEEAAHKICLESAKQKEMRRAGDLRSWLSWVRPICYRFIVHCIEHGCMDDLRRRIRRYNRQTNSEDLFSVCLLAIFAEDSANFTESDRYRISRQLWYAYRHYVPWQFLNGFLSQLHNFENQKMLSRIERGFEDWIVQRRSVDYGSVEYRGNYPEEIEVRVRDASATLVRLLENARGR